MSVRAIGSFAIEFNRKYEKLKLMRDSWGRECKSPLRCTKNSRKNMPVAFFRDRIKSSITFRSRLLLLLRAGIEDEDSERIDLRSANKTRDRSRTIFFFFFSRGTKGRCERVLVYFPKVPSKSNQTIKRKPSGNLRDGRSFGDVKRASRNLSFGFYLDCLNGPISRDRDAKLSTRYYYSRRN